METTNEALVQQLRQQTQQLIGRVRHWSGLPLETLNWKAHANSWSMLECLEHLSLYGDFYLPEIERRLLAAQPLRQAGRYKGSWLGDYFAASMMPADGKIKPMRTFASKDPRNSQLPAVTVDRFLQQQEQFLRLLERAQRVDLVRTQTRLTLPLLRLRLGDTLRFLVAHTERHVRQAERALREQGRAS
jgi:hypothetical protein